MIQKTELFLMAQEGYSDLAKDYPKLDKNIQEAMREYSRLLLDHVAEQAIDYNNFEVVDKEEILKIKDEL